MNKKYETPEVKLIEIRVQDVILDSNELPEIDLHNLEDGE